MGLIVVAANPVPSGGGPLPPSAMGALAPFTNVTQTSATVTYGAGTDPVGVTGYESNVSGGPWTDRGNVLTYSQVGLAASNTYTIGVRPYNAAGLRGPTSTRNLTTLAAAGAFLFPRYGYLDVGPGGGINRFNASRAALNACGSVSIMAWFQSIGGDCPDGVTIDSYVDAVHAVNPNTEVFAYNLARACASGSWPDMVTDVNNVSGGGFDGWLYDHTGAKITSGEDGPFPMPNGAGYEPNYADGLKFEPHAAKKFHDRVFAGGGGLDTGTKLKGVFKDNVLPQVPAPGDWKRNGGTYSKGQSIDTDFRNGQAAYFQWMKDNDGARIRTGNIAGWGVTNVSNGSMTLDNLAGLLHGGIIEGWGGIGYGQEYFAGFAASKAQLEFCVANTISAGKYVMPNLNWDNRGQDRYTYDKQAAPDWQGARYQWCEALQRDCCPVIGDLTGNYWSPGYNNFLDEQAVNPLNHTCTGKANAVAQGLLYLGLPLDGNWTPVPGVSGMYGRRYQNQGTGDIYLVLCNPLGNGSKKVNAVAAYGAGKQFRALTGTAQSVGTVNTGGLFSTLPFPDRSGQIVVLF